MKFWLGIFWLLCLTGGIGQGWCLAATEASAELAAVPLISISTGGAKLSKTDEVAAKFFLHRTTLDAKLHPYTLPALERWLPITIRRRGFSSNLYKKKQYQIRFVDADHKTAELAVFDMPAGKKWVLNGPYTDRTMIRNALVYQLGREMAASRNSPAWFAPQVRFVELQIDGDYQGIYGLTERIERSENRVVLPKIDYDHPEITPHYIMKLEAFGSEIKTKAHTRLAWVYPSDNDLAELREQDAEKAAGIENSIISHIDRFETILKSKRFADPHHGYRPLIDVDSFVDYMIVQEFSKNVDAYRKSAYFYHGPDGKIHMGPLWDFDLALGNLFFFGQHKTSGWNYNRNHFYHGNKAEFWFKRLMADRWFAQKFMQRYRELRQSVLADDKLNKDINALVHSLGNAVERNFAKWGKIRNPLFRFIMNRPPFPKRFGRNLTMMRSWCHDRLAWMDLHTQPSS